MYFASCTTRAFATSKLTIHSDGDPGRDMVIATIFSSNATYRLIKLVPIDQQAVPHQCRLQGSGGRAGSLPQLALPNTYEDVAAAGRRQSNAWVDAGRR